MKVCGVKVPDDFRSKVSDTCIQCMRRHMDKYQLEKDPWQINCTYIPRNYEDIIPEEQKKLLTKPQLKQAVFMLDPIEWAANHVWVVPQDESSEESYWTPRNYQEEIIRCTSSLKVLRWGRQLGKTESLAIMILHRAFTRKRSKQIIFAPMGKHVKLIFSRLRKYIYDSPKLRPRGPIPRDVQTPFEHIILPNGSEIMALTAGTKSGAEGETARGETASVIYFDEGDRLDEGDLDALIPILFSKPDPKIIFCSTPTGKRAFFYEICKNDPMWRESHYTSRANPAWSDWKEAFVTRRMSHMGIVHEILAEFGEPEAGVFRHANIDAALKNGNGYDINETAGPKPGCTYTMGVDWNEADNAVRIYVTEWKHDGGTTPEYCKPVYRESVSRKDYTQPLAVQRVVEINRFWRCTSVYVDKGHGSAQYEMLRAIGTQADMSSDIHTLPDRVFSSERFKAINNSEKLEIHSPVDGKAENVSYKNFTINNAARIMEGKFGMPMLSPKDEDLVNALRHFIVVRYSPTGAPVYGMSDPSVEDHDLDAWMLSLLAFTMTQTNFGNPSTITAAAFLDKVLNTKLLTRQDSGREVTVKKQLRNSNGIAIMDPEKEAMLRAGNVARVTKAAHRNIRRGFTGR